MKNQIKAFSKETYHKSEILQALLDYQQEVAAIAMGEEHKDARLSELIKYFENENKQSDGALTDSLEKFRQDSAMIENLIRGEISGSVGEAKAFESLGNVKTTNCVVRNLDLSNGNLTSEIDAVVITKKGIFIIEVKNTKKNVFIDKDGNYYNNSTYQRFDSNIVNKLRNKESLLREKLTSIGYGGIKIFSIIVFTQKHIEIQNKCRGLKTCFLSQLPYIIDDWVSFEYHTNDDLAVIEKALAAEVKSNIFPMTFDTNAVKENFIQLMTDLENAKKPPEPPVVAVNNKEPLRRPNKIYKYAGMAAVAAIVSLVVLIKK